MFRSLSLRISMLRLRGGLFGSEAVSSNKRTVLGREMRGGSQREFTLCKMLLVNVPTWHYDLVLTKDCLFQKIDHSGRSKCPQTNKRRGQLTTIKHDIHNINKYQDKYIFLGLVVLITK